MKKLSLLILCLWSALAFAQEKPQVDRFSLLPVLEQLGFKPYVSQAVPIDSEEDLKRSLNGDEPRRTVTRSEYFWPFPQIAVSPNLSVMAAAMDARAFPGRVGAASTIALISIPDQASRQPKLIWTPSLGPNSFVNSVDFMTDNLVRVGASQSEIDLLGIGFSTDYYFFDVANNREMFSLRQDLKKKKGDVFHIRHFSDDIYVIAFGDAYNVKYELISYSPLKRTFRTLLELPAERSTLINIMQSPVDLPGRDVWRQGDGSLRVLFTKFDGQEYKNFAIEVYDGVQAEIIQVDDEFQQGLRLIEGTDVYMRSESEEALEIFTMNDAGEMSMVYSSDKVSPWQHVRKVTKGFLGTEANHPDYATYLYEKGQEPQLLLKDRMIKDGHMDGGFIGLSNTNSQTGDITLFRVIYDEKTLVNSGTLGMEEANACTSILLNKIMYKISKESKKKKKK